MSNINKIVQKFPHRNITSSLVKEVNLLLSADITYIHSHGGNGLGHIVLTMAPDTYATIAGLGCIPPPNPGTALPIPARATGAVITNLEFAFKRDKDKYKLYVSINTAFKQQLLGVVEANYDCGLRNRYTGYAGSDTQVILVHMDTMYVNITEGK